MTGAPEPGRAGIVDAHHHLWVRARHPQPWIDPQTMAAIDADFTPLDLAPAARAAGVTQTVVVQSDRLRRRRRSSCWASRPTTPLVAGVVGWVDLDRRRRRRAPRPLRRGRGGDRLVGIRHLVQSETDPAYLDRPTSVGASLRWAPPASSSTCWYASTSCPRPPARPRPARGELRPGPPRQARARPPEIAELEARPAGARGRAQHDGEALRAGDRGGRSRTGRRPTFGPPSSTPSTRSGRTG